MGERGPKPLPGNVHVLRGNPSKLPAGKLLDTVRPEVSIPEAPDVLCPDGLAEWNRITPLLQELGLITQIDRATLAGYCINYGRWMSMEREIKRLNNLDPANFGNGEVAMTPNGFKQMSVLLQISNRAQEAALKYAAEFGMSPSARSRVSPSAPAQGDLFGQPGGDDGDKYFGRRR